MNASNSLKYKNITLSGKIGAGTTTLAKNLKEVLGWEHINAGEIQRQYDKKHGIDENRQGAQARPDEHEREIEKMTQDKLEKESNLIYEAWLAGFVARKIPAVLKVLLLCSDEGICIDRVVNRDNLSVKEAKQFIRQRETENISKWKKLYGDYDFWNPKYYDLVIDTYSSGQMETLGKVLDKLGYQGNLKNNPNV